MSHAEKQLNAGRCYAMNMLQVNFQELYERHLCRHSQFGINVNHLVSVGGTYIALFGVVYWIFGTEWALAMLAMPYLAVLAFNIPASVFAATVVALALLYALSFSI